MPEFSRDSEVVEPVKNGGGPLHSGAFGELQPGHQWADGYAASGAHLVRGLLSPRGTSGESMGERGGLLNRLADGFDSATSAFDGEHFSRFWHKRVFGRHPTTFSKHPGVFSRHAGASGMPADGKGLPVGYDGIAADYDGIAAGYAGIAPDYDGFAADGNGLPVGYDGMPAEHDGMAVEHAGMPVAYECCPAKQDREPAVDGFAFAGPSGANEGSRWEGSTVGRAAPTGYPQARLQREELAITAWIFDAARLQTAAGEESQVEA